MPVELVSNTQWPSLFSLSMATFLSIGPEPHTPWFSILRPLSEFFINSPTVVFKSSETSQKLTFHPPRPGRGNSRAAGGTL